MDVPPALEITADETTLRKAVKITQKTLLVILPVKKNKADKT